ncbi:hypothetical protein [Xanthomonas sp. SI]|uniref:hypothetical protein n=1 Tax=Xanthomonas sp. SI TaxID=2724123 RepID=UPI00163B5525|nr:hypothetical protein [Xanthomonas sp. SI]QNH13776.1 hypothetical protein HEP75_03239 [Xanthomonas sp. SI]
MSERYAKTDAGRQEIADRARRLPAQLRSILLVVDGHKDDSALQQIVAGLHAPQDALAQLQQMGLIARGGDAPAAPAPATSPSISPSGAPPAASATTLADAIHSSAIPGDTPVSHEAAQRYSHLYDAMSEAVRKHLGLKGYFMQLRIERCSDAAALEALLPEFTAALGKAKSPALAARWLQDTLGGDPQ